MKQSEYHYRVESSGRISGRSGDVWHPTAEMFLDGVPTTTWLGPFSVEERDLLRVMAAQEAQEGRSAGARYRVAAAPKLVPGG
jgi:hypothetical protein